MAGSRVLWWGSLLALTLASSASAASLVGSVHDLYAGPPDQSQAGAVRESNRACPYCHTPHTRAQVETPLWSARESLEAYPLSDGEEGGQVDEAVPGRTSTMCLTCHDGSVATDAVAGFVRPGVRPGGTTPATLAAESLAELPSTSSLSEEGMTHPVGVSYYFAPDLVPPPSDGKFPNGVRLVDGRVECGSCHNPHNAASPPFLATSNAGSALCYTCHVK